MNALTLFFIMKLNIISSLLFWSGLLCFGYLLWEYVVVWWDTPIESEPDWKMFWARKRKRATVAAGVMLVAMIMPSTRDAVIMTVVPAIAQHSIWERLLGSGLPDGTVNKARKLLQDGAR